MDSQEAKISMKKPSQINKQFNLLDNQVTRLYELETAMSKRLEAVLRIDIADPSKEPLEEVLVPLAGHVRDVRNTLEGNCRQI